LVFELGLDDERHHRRSGGRNAGKQYEEQSGRSSRSKLYLDVIHGRFSSSLSGQVPPSSKALLSEVDIRPCEVVAVL
jgi:hypothetical protein